MITENSKKNKSIGGSVLNLLALFFGLIIISSCSGFKQDPLADKSDVIKTAVKPGTIPPSSEALSPDTVIIDITSIDAFTEGHNGTIFLKTKKIDSGYQYSYTASNLDSFIGARIDSNTGSMTWFPPVGTVAPGTTVKNIDLLMTVTAEPLPGTNNIPLKRTQTVPITINL